MYFKHGRCSVCWPFLNKIMHSSIFSNCFIDVGVALDTEPITGRLEAEQKYTLDHSRTEKTTIFIHTHPYLAKPIHLVPCVWVETEKKLM